MKHAKRILPLVLVCLMMLSFVLPVKAQAETSQKAIKYLTNNGILKGYPNGNLGLDKEVTREEFVLFLHRMAGEPGTSTKNSFEDMKGLSKEEKKAINWAKSQEITKGVSETKFGVDGTLKYEQVLTFLYRFGLMIFGKDSYKMNAGIISPDWIGSYSDWAKEAAKWAYNKEITNGVSVDKGTKACLRGDVIQLLYNFYNKFQKKYVLIGQDAVMQTDFETKNCRDMETALRNACGSFDRITRFGYSSSSNDIDSSEGLKNLIDKAFKGATCIDMCYVYIFSHGYRENDFVGGFEVVSNEDNTGNLPKNARRMTNRISAENFYKMVEAVPGKPKFVIMIDSCFSGHFTQVFRDKGSRADIMVSSGKDEKSNIYAHSGYSIATYCWTKAMTNRLADTGSILNISYAYAGPYTMNGHGNNDGFISLAEVESAAQPIVAEIMKKSAGYQDTNYYSPSSQPAYCAFGKLG